MRTKRHRGGTPRLCPFAQRRGAVVFVQFFRSTAYTLFAIFFLTMGDSPRAYHITFGTYGARLHGGPRPAVDRRRKAYGQPIVRHNEARERMAAGRMKHQPILLTADQRVFAQRAVEEICGRGGWEFIQTACGPDHVHVLLSSRREPKAIRRWLERWLGETMSTCWPLPDGQSWWAKGGSIKWVWDREYLRKVEEYVRTQRA